MALQDSTNSPAPAQEPPAPTAYQLERRAAKERNRARKARRITRNRAGYTARLQAHLVTDSATFVALNHIS